MGEITLGDIATALAFAVALGGSIGAVVNALKKALTKLFEDQTKEIGDKLDKQGDAIKRIDSDNGKNFLVQVLSEAERGVNLTEMERIRLSEQYDHYIDGGGNSYIKDWYTRLKKEGKL